MLSTCLSLTGDIRLFEQVSAKTGFNASVQLLEKISLLVLSNGNQISQ